MATLLGPVAAQAAAASPDFSRIWTPPGTPVPGTPSVKAAKAAKPAEAAPHYPVPAKAGTSPARTPAKRESAAAELSAAAPGTATRAGALPVWVSAAPAATAARSARSVTVVQSEARAADAAGVDGLLFSLTAATSAGPTDSPAAAPDSVPDSAADSAAGAGVPVQVGLDLTALEAATGGEFATRGRLVSLPACALTTPQIPSCLVRTPVATHYDTAAKRVVTDVALPTAPGTDVAPATGAVKSSFSAVAPAAPASAPVAAPMLLAAETGPSGGGGTYGATSLASSSGWNAGGSSGAMNYSYGIQTPPALGGPAPAVALGYDSSSVDGRTSATNAQASWVGDGWDFSPGFIERTYKPCDKNGITRSGDLCWGGFNATLSLGSHSGRLVRTNDTAVSSDDATGIWHLKSDDGTKVEFGTGAANGTDNGAYAKVTDGSGTVYYFGLNHLPGGDRSDPATNSASTVPVYAPNSGDRCYDAAKGAASWCQMWQRLSLDYVVDAHGNLTTYTWAPEANFYSRGGGQNSGNGALTSYTRATNPTKIEYGQRLSEQVAAKGALQPAARVTFSVDERCLDTGALCTEANRTVANKTNWPDVPVDQECKSTGTCTNYGPAFFTTKRLRAVDTEVRVNGAWQPVDHYELRHSFPDPSDTTSQKAMWLDSVQRTGKTATPNISTPPVSFVPVMLPNRVDGTDLVPAPPLMNRPRIQQIKNETGGVLNVDYNLPGCSRINNVMPTAEDDNTKACYPVRWLPTGSVVGADPVLDWFNHYTVSSLTENDFATSSPAKITSYAYGPAAWHRDDNEFTDTKSRTWGDFRGFATVTVTTGSGNDGPKGQSRTTYRQGMDGDARKAGGTRSVHLTDLLGNDVTDVDWLGGQVLQTETFDQAGGTATEQSVNGSSGPVTTATHVRGNGLPDLVARYNATASTSVSRTRKTDGTWRTGTTTVTSDPAHPSRVLTLLSQAEGLPDLCTRTGYATGPDPQRTDLVAETLTVSGSAACTANPTTANTVSRGIALYDGLPYGQAGATADPTGRATLDRYDGAGAPVFVQVSSSTFDAYGRITSVTDPGTKDVQHPDGATNRTGYTPAAAGELPSTMTLSAPIPGSSTTATWDTVTTLDPRRALPLTVKDTNDRTATETYDALGRLTGVWAPGRTPASKPNPNQKFDYTVSNTTGVPSTITTSTLTSDGSSPVYVRQVSLLDGFARARQTQSSPAGPGYLGRMVSDTLYDSQGRVRATNAAWYNSDSAPSQTLVTAVDSSIPAQSRTTFDGLGRPIVTALWSLGVEQSRTTTSYPGADRTDTVPPQGSWPISTLTDARGRATELWQYSTPTVTGVAADATITRYTYTVDGKPAGRVDAMGNTWSYGYDQRGRQVSTTDPDTGTTTQTYDLASRQTTSTNAKGQVLSYTYDLNGRKTGLYEGTVSAANQLAAWTFDSVAKGLPASSTRYVGGAAGQAYTTTVTGYDDGYRPTGSTITIPGTEAGQAAGTTFSYTSSAQYDQLTGNPTTTTLPALGGVPTEELAYSRNSYGQLVSYAGATTYDVQSTYDAFGRPVRSTVNPWATQVVSTVDYDQATGRVRSQYLDKQTSTTGAVQQTNYTYNPSGTITSITDIPDNNPSQTSRQCFSYDSLGRLTTAWTDTGSITTPDPLQHRTLDQGACTNATPTSGAVAPAKNTVGGANPYWQDYSYDLTGNRTKLVRHNPLGDTNKDTTTTQTYGAPGSVNTPTAPLGAGGGTGGPHSLLTSKITGTGASYQTSTNEYDATGNTTKITNSSGNRTLAAGYVIKSGENVRSNNTQLAMQADGNLVLTSLRTGNVLWSSNTANHPGATATMQDDGNFVVYDTAHTALWASNTYVGAGSGYFAAVQDDGKFLVYAPGYVTKWGTSSWNAVDAANTATMTWNSEGKLASHTRGGATTTYLYDADGNQLIRRNPGRNTINLGGDELLVDTATKAQTGTRYYPIPGGMTMVRTGTGTAPGAFVVQTADHHGTNSVSIDLTTLNTTRRPTDPFGNPRDTLPAASAWAGDKGYVDGTKDTDTNLTNLGARQYQPGTGRFISPDPILDPGDPQQWNGYAYSNNNPVNLSDPNGLMACRTPDECDGGTQIGMNTPSKEGLSTTATATNNNDADGTGHQARGTRSNGTCCRVQKVLVYPKVAIPENWDKGAEFIDAFYKQMQNFCKGDFGKNSCPYTDPEHEVGEYQLKYTIMQACLDIGKENCPKELFSIQALIAAGVSSGMALGREGSTGGAGKIPLGKGSFGWTQGRAQGGWEVRGGCPNSFPAETRVLLEDGSAKNISDVKVGDTVIATDPETGETSPEKVTAVIVTPTDRDFTDLTVESATGDQKLTSTQHHPFWNATTQSWTDAVDLRVGDSLRQPDGRLARISGTHSYANSLTAYNLTVDRIHTYYVLAGNTPILVHNASGPLPCRVVNGWPKQEKSNCEDCAYKIQDMIGGDVVHITPQKPFPRLGQSTHDPYGSWDEHYVVVKDGRVYDGTTGRAGLTKDQFKAQWGENAPYINFGF